MYALTGLLSVTSMLTFTRLLIADTGTNRLRYVVTTLLLLYSHNFAIFIVLAQSVFVLWQWLNHRHTVSIPLWLGLQCLIGLLYLPWALVVIAQIETVSTGFWISKPGILEPLRTLMNYQWLPLWSFAALAGLTAVGLGSAR